MALKNGKRTVCVCAKSLQGCLSEWNDPISWEGLGSGESAFSCNESEMPVGHLGKNQRENTRATSGWRHALKSHRQKTGVSSHEAERQLGKSVDSSRKGEDCMAGPPGERLGEIQRNQQRVHEGAVED